LDRAARRSRSARKTRRCYSPRIGFEEETLVSTRPRVDEEGGEGVAGYVHKEREGRRRRRRREIVFVNLLI